MITNKPTDHVISCQTCKKHFDCGVGIEGKKSDYGIIVDCLTQGDFTEYKGWPRVTSQKLASIWSYSKWEPLNPPLPEELFEI